MAEVEHKHRKRKRWLIPVFIILILVILHLALEPVALYYINKELDQLEGYEGHVEDIDIHLWRGAYEIHELNIRKVDAEGSEPFFRTPLMDISIQWKALFKGSIVSEIVTHEPVINFVMEPSGKVRDGGNNNWIETIKGFSPLKINRFEVNNGSLHYKDQTTDPQMDIAVYSIEALATNLTNVNESDELLPATIEATGKTSGDGKMKGNMKLNPLMEVPDFDLNVEVNGVSLTYLKNFTQAYAGFTFKEGVMYLSSEVAMKDGNFEGYIKPVLENIKVIDLDNKNTSFWRKMWEVVVGLTLELFENQSKDQFATRVPFSGTVNGTDVGLTTTILNVLKNAFINSFSKNIEQSVNINDVSKKKEDKGFFGRLFDGDDDEEEEKKKEEEKK